jgi:predicted transposase YdaD
MLQLGDIRKSKVYKEAQTEGRMEAREDIAARLLAQKFDVAKVAELTGLTVQQVRRLGKKKGDK